MKTPFPVLLRRFLLAWGTLSLLAALVWAIALGYHTGFGNYERIDGAAGADLRFVLAECGLPTDRIEKISRTLVATHAMGGDHLYAYAVHLTRVDASELAPAAVAAKAQVYRGDQLPVVVKEALSTSLSWLGRNNVGWFPTFTELQSDAFYIYPMVIQLRRGVTTEVEFVLIKPADSTLFYLSSKD